MQLEGKVAIVTGGGQGIGEGIAVKLAKSGAFVVVCDMNAENAHRVLQVIQKKGGKGAVAVANTAVFSDVENMFLQVMEEHGHLDILVNNAGINRDAMLHKMEKQQWDDVIAVNLTGVFYCTQCAAKIMREAEKGRIINIASASIEGNFGQANYAAAKAGVVGLTKTAAKELAKKGVTANAICPGFIETSMTKGIPSKAWDIMMSKIPMGRVGQPDDVANLAAFLASDEAGYITGEVIHVGGGFKL